MLQLVFLILAVILLLSASVLILNTIRLAIFARRREVSVMKLVGATNWFIRLPFMFEGVIQGLLGAVVAAVVVVVLHVVLDALATPDDEHLGYQMRLSTGEVVSTTLVVLLIGVADRVDRLGPGYPALPRRLTDQTPPAGRYQPLLAPLARTKSLTA